MSSQTSPLFRWANIAVAVVAGAWTLFHLYWDLTKHTSDDFWGQALLVLFVAALILAFVRYAQERSALIASTPNDAYPEPAIARFFLSTGGAVERQLDLPVAAIPSSAATDCLVCWS